MITLSTIFFMVVALSTLGCAIMVVVSSKLVHSAFWLIAAFLGIAVFFVLLQASFLAVVQVVIYIGAIAILIIFAIMLTRNIAGDSGPSFNENWGWAAGIAIFFFTASLLMIRTFPGFAVTAPPFSERADLVQTLGQALVDPNGFALPFEVASILLVAALIGSVFIARERK